MRETPVPKGRQRAAVFFDRDGTLNRDDGYTYKVADLELLPGAAEAIRACNDAGVLAIVVTNQSGIARGKFAVEDMTRFHEAMQAQLRTSGAHIDAFYFCPYLEDAAVPAFARADHPDRKPNAGLFRRALLEWSIDPAQAFVVGDHQRDVDAGAAAGMTGALVRPGELFDAVKRRLDVISRASSSRANPGAELTMRAAQARAWLFDHALPIWWEKGFDRRGGCFHEALDVGGAPVASLRRVRVQARQTAVYAGAGALGWTGPWREAVEAGAKVLLQRAIRPDGGTAHLLDETGARADARRDLYDTAFVTFALSQASAALSRPALAAEAESLFRWVQANWRHPAGGYVEGEVTPSPPRRQNPHMHLLEALLSLHEATGRAEHLQSALDVVRLFETRFVDPAHTAVLEYFDDALRPAPGDDGRITEPGHQFEWAWLVDRVYKLSGHDARDLARRVHIHGEVYGVTPATGVIADEVWADGVVKTPTSRLWPHTERIKANVVHYERTGDPQSAAHAVQAFDALMAYCQTPVAGLWHDRRLADGSFAEGPAPASSFYHIMLALSELIRVAEGGLPFAPRAS